MNCRSIFSVNSALSAGGDTTIKKARLMTGLFYYSVNISYLINTIFFVSVKSPDLMV